MAVRAAVTRDFDDLCVSTMRTLARPPRAATPARPSNQDGEHGTENRDDHRHRNAESAAMLFGLRTLRMFRFGICFRHRRTPTRSSLPNVLACHGLSRSGSRPAHRGRIRRWAAARCAGAAAR